MKTPDPRNIAAHTGVCRGCGRTYHLDKHGKIRVHWLDPKARKRKCEGAETLPLGRAAADMGIDAIRAMIDGKLPAAIRRGVATMAQTHTSDGITVSMHDLAAADILERKALGLERYKRELKAFNGRNPLVDSYQEKLDDVVYTRQAMIEWDAMAARIVELEAALRKVDAAVQHHALRGDIPGHFISTVRPALALVQPVKATKQRKKNKVA